MTATRQDTRAPGGLPDKLRQNRGFVLLASCRGLMVVARQTLAVAVGWDVYERTSNVVDLGLIGLCMALPIFLFTIPAGIVADRYDRRIVLAAGLVTQSITAALIGCWFQFGGPSVTPIFALLLVSGSAHSFLNPALSSTLPRLVPRELFSNAIAASSSVNKVAQLAGPVAAGFLLGADWPIAYTVTATGFFLAALCALLIRLNLRIEDPDEIGWSALFGGFKFVWETPVVFAAMTIDLIAVLFGGVIGILPVYAADILHVGSEGLGMMRAAPAIGAFTIGAILASHRLPWPVGKSFFASLTVFSLAILIFSVSRSFPLSLAALAAYGAADMVSIYVRQTLIQLDTPDDLRGRVGAVHSFSAGGSTQLGDLRAGLMAGVVGTPAAVAIGGLVTLAATGLWFQLFPTLRKMSRF
ncbi:MFS transporter [Amaricoccus solimangrovi]|nr:MFS transporter [Amaricoccus solimangrovi]